MVVIHDQVLLFLGLLWLEFEEVLQEHEVVLFEVLGRLDLLVQLPLVVLEVVVDLLDAAALSLKVVLDHPWLKLADVLGVRVQ